MKKLILISSTLLAFAFAVGCGDGKTDKEKCEEDDKKEWKDEKCVDKEEEVLVVEDDEVTAIKTYTVTNKHSTIITVSSGDLEPLLLSKGQCGKVTSAQVASLKIAYSTGPNRVSHLCGQENNACDAKNYDVTAGSTGPQLSLAPVMNSSADCKTLVAKEARSSQS